MLTESQYNSRNPIGNSSNFTANRYSYKGKYYLTRSEAENARHADYIVYRSRYSAGSGNPELDSTSSRTPGATSGMSGDDMIADNNGGLGSTDAPSGIPGSGGPGSSDTWPRAGSGVAPSGIPGSGGPGSSDTWPTSPTSPTQSSTGMSGSEMMADNENNNYSLDSRSSGPSSGPIGGVSIAPPAGWNEELYLKAYPDVATAVQRGQFSSGLEHWHLHGKNEAWRVSDFSNVPADFNEEAYLAANPDVVQNWNGTGLSHYALNGYREGRNIGGSALSINEQRTIDTIIDGMIERNDANGDGRLTEEELGNNVWTQYSDQARSDGVVTREEAIELVRRRTESGYRASDTDPIGKQKQAIRALMGHELSNQVYTVQAVEEKLGARLPSWIIQDGKVSDSELAMYIKNQIDRGNLQYTSSGSVELTDQGRQEIALNAPAAQQTVSIPEAPVAATPEPEPSDTNRKPDQQEKKKQPVGEGKIDPDKQDIVSTRPVDPNNDNQGKDKERFWTGGSIEAAIENHFGDDLKNGGFIPTHEAQEELAKLGITLPGSVAANGKLTEKKLAGFIRDEVKAGRMDFTPEGGLRPHDAGGGSSAGTGTVSNSPAVPVVEYDSDGDGEADVVGIDRDGDGVPEKGGPIQPENEAESSVGEEVASTTEGDQKPMGSESVAQRPVESDDTPGGATLADQTATVGGGKVYVAKGGSITKMIQDLAAQDGKKLTGHEAWKIYENMKDEFSKMDVTYRMKNGQIGLSNPGEMRVDNHIVDKIRTLSGGEGALQASRIGDNNSGLKTLGQDSGPMGLAGNSQVRNNSSGSSGLPSMP